MPDEILFKERVSSNRTEALFLALTVLFALLLILRLNTADLDILAVVFLVLSCLFLFYSVNYRVLIIHLTPESLTLTFGIFTWIVSLDNIEACRLDDIPLLMRLGGAGIHFMVVHQRYRASFNFLDHPRVTITFKRKKGLVKELSFSTCRPDDILRLIQESISTRETTT